VCSHIPNTINGVAFGFCYKTGSVCTHFPINIVKKDELILKENNTELAPNSTILIHPAMTVINKNII
ncbi:hypothetical protein E2I00_006083, partial [Balaenoptera physalus]